MSYFRHGTRAVYGQSLKATTLEESDASNFKYTKLYYISEIKDELNHVCTVKNAKKVTNAVIWEFLVSEGFTR